MKCIVAMIASKKPCNCLVLAGTFANGKGRTCILLVRWLHAEVDVHQMVASAACTVCCSKEAKKQNPNPHQRAWGKDTDSLVTQRTHQHSVMTRLLAMAAPFSIFLFWTSKAPANAVRKAPVA